MTTASRTAAKSTTHPKKLLPLGEAPLWYKDVVIYQLHVRAYFDSNGDGIGDFRGLTEKLDYLQDLGVTALWLQPFYPSPLRDDGYDIANYMNVHSDYGTIRDLRNFLREANERGIHVITELVLNHTSDQHAWFQRARRARPGSRWRDFYVWSDTPTKFAEARIIFKDFETSNWTFDPVAGAYYWHRFYSHQPDLNFDNPEVQRAMFRVVDFWLSMGISGLRLDAVPYLYEREGTNCENLPETHSFLKTLRKHVDERYADRLLLAEANQWPEDAVAYFGSNDECHMAFHFPLMPRMFMALRMEDRFPIVDVLQQTPSIDPDCQWAIFLRNHDELTLEMVTDEERDYMYRVYASDLHARINLGIRRRLAPLMNHDDNKIELMNSLLFSLPGTPVIYYGDEIDMGDNFYLGDRNGVRTPMQWSTDRNAGFSRANPQQLYFPVIIDPEYHYESVNVEAQQANMDSPLWWMKRRISLRKRHKAFSRGSLEFRYPDNHKVLAFIRRYEGETILVVANLSRHLQHAYLNLSEFAGSTPVEMTGQTALPTIGEEPYSLTMGPYGCYWFSLESRREEALGLQTAPGGEVLVPIIAIGGDWQDLFRKESGPLLPPMLLPHIRGRRWFGGKGRNIQASSIRDVIPIAGHHGTAYLVFIRIEYSEGDPESYQLLVGFVPEEREAEILERSPQAAILRLEATGHRGQSGLLFDALASADLRDFLLEAVERRRVFRGDNGALAGMPARNLRLALSAAEGPLASALLRTEQSNTSILYGNSLILKLFRKVNTGVNPDLEIGRFLTGVALFRQTPQVAGWLEYRQPLERQSTTVGILQEFVPNHGDAWQYTLDNLGHYFERVLPMVEAQAPPVPPKGLLIDQSRQCLPTIALETMGPYIASAELLGQRTAEMHVALASHPETPDFAPEPFSIGYQRSLYQSLRTNLVQLMQALRGRLQALPDDIRDVATKVVASETAILQRYEAVRGRRINAVRIRCHGDYHLGQVLYTGRDFVVIDFEGEPARPLSERKLKRNPLRDVAGMLRSFHYASQAVLMGQTPLVIRPEDEPVLEWWAHLWYTWTSSAFLKGYLQAMDGRALLPSAPGDLQTLLDAYLLDKAIYEVGYEMNNRPTWLRVPLQGILQLLEIQP